MATKKTSKKASGAKASATKARSFPRKIYANASPISIGGVSMFETGLVPDAGMVGNFASDDAVVERAVNLLRDAGFDVLAANNYLINICGSKTTFEKAFDTELAMIERPVIRQGEETSGTHIDSMNSAVDGLVPVAGTRFEEVLEGVAIEEPRYLDSPNPFPPPVDYFHLGVPGDVALGLNAEKAHRGAITGRGVQVAMLDSGMAPHPFFSGRGYRVNATVLGPGTSDPTEDQIGHGTGEAANIFAAAPDVELTPIKIASSSGALVNTTAAMNLAAAMNPDIITNSWGSNRPSGSLSAADQALAASVAAAWANGITVVFSAGNGSWGFPGQHPDVISVGGVYMEADGSMRASNYTSGFNSNIYPGRQVPDLSGLCGDGPKAAYIMLPLQEGADIDVGNAGGNHPGGDETASNDGWAAFSGTSAAAPQVAGVCALIKQACPRLGPDAIRGILMSTARDVTTGTNALGNSAGTGYDIATGSGLVDAHKAVMLAKLRCLVVNPVIPIRPVGEAIPINPVVPAIPITPVVPFRPPFGPIVPVLPFRPIQPVRPFRPIGPVVPLRPIAPFDPGPFDQGGAAMQPGPGLSADDLAELERLVLSDDTFDL